MASVGFTLRGGAVATVSRCVSEHAGASEGGLWRIIARRNCEYAIICIRIVLGFFDAYFDRNMMDPEFTLEEPPPPTTPLERQMSTRRPTSVGLATPKSLAAGGAFEFADGSVEMSINESASEPGDDSESDEETETSKTVMRMWWDDAITSLRNNLTDLYQTKPKVLLGEHFSVLYSAIEVTTGACQEQDIDILMLETPDMLRDLTGSFDMSDESGNPMAHNELSDRREELLAQFMEQLTVNDDLAEDINGDKDKMVDSMDGSWIMNSGQEAKDLALQYMAQRYKDTGYIPDQKQVEAALMQMGYR